MPSFLETTRIASSAWLSVVYVYSTRPLALSEACCGPTPG
jgi:hypothetical protein